MSVAAMDVVQLMPALLQALRIGDRDLELTTLAILAENAKEASAVLGDHVGSVVAACLQLATAQRPGSVVWRPACPVPVGLRPLTGRTSSRAVVCTVHASVR